MATIIDIADSIVAELNAATFSQPVSAVRHYAPQFEMTEMTTLHVTVVPKGLSSQLLDRSRDTFEYLVDVAVQQKVDQTNPSLDALMNLVEEIADHFRAASLASFPNARCVEVKNEPVYSPEHLTELGQFTSVLTLIFKVWR
ncbi:MAG: hypothetical protein L0228_10795 [Planctomycetes bacterium]|nr:hypothetical protein [Planctomycetota bacterium]